MASVSMRISSAFIYLLETGSIGGEEAAKFFKTLVEKEALSCKKLNTVQPEILVGIKFGGWALNHHFKNIGGFKFGGSVRDCHTYICKYEILSDFNLAGSKLDRQTAKPPNLIPRQIFRLYNISVGYCSHTHRPCPLCIMHEFLLMRTGLIRVGKGRPQHISKLQDNADARRVRGMCSQSSSFNK